MIILYRAPTGNQVKVKDSSRVWGFGLGHRSLNFARHGDDFVHTTQLMDEHYLTWVL